MSKKILVIGATGNVGQPLVAELIAKGEKVVAATRNATPIAGAEAVKFDLAHPHNLDTILENVDRVYLMVPGGNLNLTELTAPIIAAAAQRKIKVVLQTAMGVEVDDTIPFRQVELALIASGTPYVILRPNWFADNFHTYWSHGVKSGHLALPAAGGKSSFIDVRDIAASAAAVLTTRNYDGRDFALTGPKAHDYSEAAAELSKVAGRTIIYTPIKDEAFVAGLKAVGVPNDYADFLGFLFGPVRDGWTATVTDSVQILTGKEPRSLETYAKDHSVLFTSS